MKDILREAFPDRSDEQIIPIGLIYAGVRWGKDYRYGEVPNDKQGNPINVCKDESTYWPYLAWLAAYLYELDAIINSEQRGLCNYINKMLPEDGIQLIGMNAALYQVETELMESWIEENQPFENYAERIREMLEEDQDYDENADRKLYEKVQHELADHQRCCPDVRHADIPYRVPLSIALRKVETKDSRVELLHSFYQIYDEYIRK